MRPLQKSLSLGRGILLCSSFALLAACGSSKNNNRESEDISQAFEILGALPETVQHPENNPPNVQKTHLGEMLFWDPILSGNQDIACASCHHPAMGFADALQLSQGVGAMGLGAERAGGELVKRHAPTIINTAFNGIDINHDYSPELAPMFWDNRALSLEHQAILPILSEQEMRGSAIKEEDLLPLLISRLQDIPEYQNLFSQAFGDAEINALRIAQAIATFQRSIIANQSRFDDFMRGSDSALNRSEKQGLAIFMDAGCADCHNGPMLSNYQLHVVGVPESEASQLLPGYDQGAGGFAFRTPSLRNLSMTAPYMHNGAFDTLEEVIAFYFDAAEGEDIHPALSLADLDPEIRDLELGDDDDGDEGDEEDELEEEDEGENEALAALVSFLRTLDDNSFKQRVPESVPSGLNPGGNI